MEWKGMERNRMEWYGMGWYGMVWNGMVCVCICNTYISYIYIIRIIIYMCVYIYYYIYIYTYTDMQNMMCFSRIIRSGHVPGRSRSPGCLAGCPWGQWGLRHRGGLSFRLVFPNVWECLGYFKGILCNFCLFKHVGCLNQFWECDLFPESVWAQGSSNSGGLYLIFSSSHLLIFTSSLPPSHLHIFSHTFSSSHLLSHLLIFTSSLTPSHLHIFSHTFSSSHLLSHLLIFTPSLSLTLSPFSLSFLSPFSLSRLLYLSLFRPRVVPAVSHQTSTLSHKMRVDRQKLR